MQLSHAPEIELEDIANLDGGVFPDEEDGMIVVRDIPVAVVQPNSDELAEALEGEATQGSHEYLMLLGKNGATIAVLLYDPYVSFKFRLPFPAYWETAQKVINNGGLLGITTPAAPETIMLLRFEKPPE